MNVESHLPPPGGAIVPIGSDHPETPAVPNDYLTRYMSEMDGIDATDEQKLELLGILYSIMRSFVELGIDVGSAEIVPSIDDDEGAHDSR